jgi:hypothetical protein
MCEYGQDCASVQRGGAIEKENSAAEARSYLEGTLRHGVLGSHADLLALLGNRHEAAELARLAAVDLDAVVQVLLLQKRSTKNCERKKDQARFQMQHATRGSNKSGPMLRAKTQFQKGVETLGNVQKR